MELLYFIVASFLVVIVPGPTVSLIIANSLKFGVKAGLLNVLGTQIGVLILIFLLALGFEFISLFVDQIIKILRIFGAIYLIILGIINIIYGALNAFAQDNVKRRIACSSVSHMGFVLLGIGAIL